jgi:Kdo2-lipid A phosphotransferase
MRNWQPRLLIGAHLAAALLLLSWLLPPTSLLWDWLDENLFRWLNGSLIDRPLLQLFWAILCARVLDLPVAAILGLYSMLYLFRTGRRNEVGERMARMAYMGLFLSGAVYLFHILLFKGFNYYRLSPSFALEAKVWLSQSVDIGLNIRDKSRHSFPSDHGVQLYYWTAFFFRFGGRRLGLSALGLTLFLSVPRLVSGAHWMSDGVVGSLFLVLIVWSWAVGTPLMERAVGLLTPLFNWTLQTLSSAASGIAMRPWRTLPK